MTRIAHYCQKCLTANPIGLEFCARCGTKLMLVVEPRSARFDSGEARLANEEHLLERISALENRQTRLTEKLERGLDLLLRQAQNSYFDRSLIRALIGLLTDDGLVQSDRLEHLWNNLCRRDAAEQEEHDQREQLRLRILASYGGKDSGDFEQVVNEGFMLIEDKQTDLGIRALRRASEMAAQNSPLLCFVGGHFFKTGKTRLAREYLARAHEIAPEDVRVSLLLGLTCADLGDSERAKQLLKRATRRGMSSFAAHYGLGRLFAAEENWRQALREFKQALSRKPSPEAHYVLGCLYYELSRDSLAVRHLRKAIEMDGGYREAFYLLGLLHKRNGHEDLARQAFEGAGEAEIIRPPRKSDIVSTTATSLPMFSGAVARSRRLVTGGNRRLAQALREDALRAFAAQQAVPESPSK